jgi:hypothetical protein
MPNWKVLIREARERVPSPVVAETFLKAFQTASRPVLLACGDQEYVVKSKDAGRMIVTDQIVGRLGHAIGASVAEVTLVEVPKGLIDSEPQMSHMSPGVAHGSKWFPDCSEQLGFEHTHVPENRPRFAGLALLYGWATAGDHQFIYENTEPRLVHSVDHGHFFPGSNGWTKEMLEQAPAAVPDGTIVSTCSLTGVELQAAKEALRAPTENVIASAVSAPSVGWGITLTERIAVAVYLAGRSESIF